MIRRKFGGRLWTPLKAWRHAASVFSTSLIQYEVP